MTFLCMETQPRNIEVLCRRCHLPPLNSNQASRMAFTTPSKLLKHPIIILIVCSLITLSDGYDGGGHHHHRHRRQQRPLTATSDDPIPLGPWSPGLQLLPQGSSSSISVAGQRGILTSSSDVSSNSSWVFVSQNASTVMAHIGSTAVLECQVKSESMYGMITWSRVEDEMRPYTLLTIGDQNYIEDKRIFVSKPSHLSQFGWALRIQRVQPEDAGRYECQATTHPPQSIVIQLVVVEATAVILGTQEKIIKSGSTLQLHCHMRNATEEPQYIFWYHNDKMINYDARPGLKVTKDASGSSLSLDRVEPRDSGNYTCSPHNIKAAWVVVHILSSGSTAASVQKPGQPQDDEEHAGSRSKVLAEEEGNTTKKRKKVELSNNPPSAAVQSINNQGQMPTSQIHLLSLFILYYDGFIR